MTSHLPPQHPDDVRHEITLDYARMAADLEEIARNPGPAIDGEDVARGPDGEALEDEDVRSQARELLAACRQDWATMLGAGLN